MGGFAALNAAVRLAKIVAALEQVGLTVLVLGGHAVRYYGIDRNTIDYDLHISPADWGDLGSRLDRSPLAAGRPLSQGPSWRPDSFRRFLLGQLPDGRDEWLEFWRNNHLLPPFADLYSRREEGPYGGRSLAFLSLPDLIRSKETERETDWQDVAGLEEIQDGRLLHGLTTGTLSAVDALAGVRSRRGLESFLQAGHMKDPALVRQALLQTRLSITQAILLPWAVADAAPPMPTVPIEPVVVNRFRTVVPASALHLALIEVVRRQYKLAMQNADAADKQSIRAAQVHPPPNNP
jgi:hypothetical protein